MSTWLAGVIGASVGGAISLVSTLVASYFGPRWLEERREKQKEEREDLPRKRMLKAALGDPRFPDGRLLETLCVYTGTAPEECRRLLIQLEARGSRLQNGEGWVLISRKPLDQQ